MVVNQWRNTTEINWTVHCKLSQLPERLILQLGEMTHCLSVSSSIDCWTTGSPLDMAITPKVFCLLTLRPCIWALKGTIRVQRLASDRFRVQSTHTTPLVQSVGWGKIKPIW